MIRTFLGITAALTFAGSAFAQTVAQTESVQIDGQNGRNIRVELRQAAERVCLASQDPRFPENYDYMATEACESSTYTAALQQAKRANPAAFQRVNTQTVAER